MVGERAKRKLTAILSADVKGYSRLMNEDELSTVETLKRYREIISSLVQQFRGRVIDATGDNILAEFASVVDAVECAVKIQEDLHEMNASLPENRRMAFRIGVNLGDVIDDEGRIYGDGVTEEIITGLSKVPELFVIARNSAFTYKGEPVKVQKVAEDLGVRYVLEGERSQVSRKPANNRPTCRCRKRSSSMGRSLGSRT